MSIDISALERALAEHKVYDAWQYVKSLQETLEYMSVSYNMLIKVHDHRVATLAAVEQDIIHQAHETGEGRCTSNDLDRTNLVIGGYEIDDAVFMRKTAMEFFHYGRISMDVLFQIVNAALLGDEAYSVEDKGLLRKLLNKLTTKPEFATLLQLMDTNKNDPRYQYLMAFDNYIKHIKTVLITVKNSILIGNADVFQLNAFSYGDVNYPAENALNKIKEIHDYVISNEMQICIYLSEQKDNLKHISLSDSLVRRQLGRIDDKCFDALVLDSYCPDKMKYFSCFINNLTENHTVGLNYYGITLIDEAILEKLIAYKKHICFTDSIHLKTFKRFCKDAYEKGKWIVHFGV